MSVRIIVADVLDGLAQLEAESVQCVVTSPPYWGLRDYGMPGQIGLERTVTEYVDRMVAVFREVWRVLRSDGVLWLNLGDCYATGAGAVGDCPGGGEQGARWKGEVTRERDGRRRQRPATNGRGEAQDAGDRSAVGPTTQPNRMPIPGLKPKDLVGIPWRVAFALQAAGWWLRSDVIWSKPNPMPESVTDRPTKAHEYLFLMARSERYRYDADAIRTPPKAPTTKMPDGWDTAAGAHGTIHRNGREKGEKIDKQRGHSRRHAGFNERWDEMERAEQVAGGANARTVWEVATAPFAEAHFATFPPALVKPCILSGCPQGETVLDPFTGAGTVGLVADRLGRSFVGIEINPEYAAMAERRIRSDCPLFCDPVLTRSDP